MVAPTGTLCFRGPVTLVWLHRAAGGVPPALRFVRIIGPREDKKAPPGYACLDEFQVLQIRGARSRNHKKMSCTARHLHTNCVVRRCPLLLIFWTEPQYRRCLPISVGSIGYHLTYSSLNL